MRCAEEEKEELVRQLRAYDTALELIPGTRTVVRSTFTD